MRALLVREHRFGDVESGERGDRGQADDHGRESRNTGLRGDDGKRQDARADDRGGEDEDPACRRYGVAQGQGFAGNASFTTSASHARLQLNHGLLTDAQKTTLGTIQVSNEHDDA